MNDVQLAAASAGKGLANTATAIGTAQNGLNTFTSNANTALENGSGLISQAAQRHHHQHQQGDHGRLVRKRHRTAGRQQHAKRDR